MQTVRFVSGVALLAFAAGLAAAQEISAEGGFRLVPAVPAGVAAMRANVRPDKFQPAEVRWDALKAHLAMAPLEDTPAARDPLFLTIPHPDGGWATFEIVESPIMQPGLAAAFPDIKTYAGRNVDDRSSTIRLDYTMHGFHAQVFSTQGSYYVDPFSMGETSIVTSYWKKDLKAPKAWRCGTVDDVPAEEAPSGGFRDRAVVTRSEFKLAVAATVEYTIFHGGTQAAGQAAIVTAVNRINQVYERDLSTRFILVENNEDLVFVGEDNYFNDASGQDLVTNHENCNALIGSANYDIGHLLCTSEGGIASISSVCTASRKGQGLSGQPEPVNDPFIIDYVCHEMGHQFNGRHCFNNCAGGPGDAYQYAFEPGSGTTIMAYAGICDEFTNLQPNSDELFHSGSLDLMASFISGRSCDDEVVLENNTPTVSAGPDVVIPKETPFVLTADGDDPDGDLLTYSWEQRDTGNLTVPMGVDNGTGPLFRVWEPVASPKRFFPRLQSLLTNTTVLGETLPTRARFMNFRVVARDNFPTGGGVGVDDMRITVAGTAGPFLVTEPNDPAPRSGPITVTWDVANTDAAPVSCQLVNILLSPDGGQTYPLILASRTANDGTEDVTLPEIASNAARIKVEAAENIFFDISDANFAIRPVESGTFAATGIYTVNDTAPNGNGNRFIEPGESNIGLFVRMAKQGNPTATGVVGTLISLTPTVTVVTSTSPYPAMQPGFGRDNQRPFIIAVSPDHPCGNPIDLRLTLDSSQGSATHDFTLQTGAGFGTTTEIFNYSGDAVAIPDNNANGVLLELPVSGITGDVVDVNFSFDGEGCSTLPNSPTVGLAHTWVGDLIVTLNGPGGFPSVRVIDRPGYVSTGDGNSGNNFCQTVFTDDAPNAIENAASTAAPFSGNWRPNLPLSVFNGIDPNGVWTLRVVDRAASDVGIVRSFSVAITRSGPQCQPPVEPPCPADHNGDGAVDADDVISYFRAWDNSEPSADFNNDGGVDSDDIIGFFNAWDAGC
ncbi:MAG: reprolysin-like metallopeptidase [Phycisphaerales bacterium]